MNNGLDKLQQFNTSYLMNDHLSLSKQEVFKEFSHRKVLIRDTRYNEYDPSCP